MIEYMMDNWCGDASENERMAADLKGALFMIVGSMECPAREYMQYPAAVAEALEYLRTHDFTKMADGKYPIRGEQSFALVQRYHTKPMAECYPEAHKRFMDVQYVAEGEEYLGWCAFSPEMIVHTPYDADKDIVFFEKMVPDSNLVLSAGSFAVLSPEDVHRPCGAIEDVPGPVTKVVVKIAVALLQEK